MIDFNWKNVVMIGIPPKRDPKSLSVLTEAFTSFFESLGGSKLVDFRGNKCGCFFHHHNYWSYTIKIKKGDYLGVNDVEFIHIKLPNTDFVYYHNFTNRGDYDLTLPEAKLLSTTIQQAIGDETYTQIKHTFTFAQHRLDLRFATADSKRCIHVSFADYPPQGRSFHDPQELEERILARKAQDS